MAHQGNHDNKLQGLIVLLYGRGGFGKSTLLGRYRAMAQEEDRHLRVSTIVDWEFAVAGKRSLFNPPLGQEVDAAEYYRVLCAQLAMALEKDPRSFREYQKAIKAVDEARKKASGILESVQKDDRYAAFRTVTIEGLTALVRSFVPGSGVISDGLLARMEMQSHRPKIRIRRPLRPPYHLSIAFVAGGYLLFSHLP